MSLLLSSKWANLQSWGFKKFVYHRNLQMPNLLLTQILAKLSTLKEGAERNFWLKLNRQDNLSSYVEAAIC